MFYQHELLTSRKHGITTVWLVATLGSKSTLKKVSRKAILDVDVSKACDTISTPEAPLALRLQSNLLYGITRVYAQQCGYVLSDVEATKNNMRLMFNVVQKNSLDAEGGTKGRADQLQLQDDANFLPDLDMPMALDDLDLDLTTTAESQHSALSPYSSQRRDQGVGSQDDIGGLVIPHQPSSFIGGPVGGFGSTSVRGDSGAGSRVGRGFLDDDLGFQIDDDGNLFMGDASAPQPSGPFGGSERLGRGSISGTTRGREVADEDMVIPPADDGFVPLRDEGFVPLLDDSHVAGPNAQAVQQAIVQQDANNQVTSEETAIAPQRRRRHVVNKPIPLDQNVELRNGDLVKWHDNYLTNMKEAILQKEAMRTVSLAKKNAELLMLGIGNRGPLSIFEGSQLLETLTGVKLTWSGEKRQRGEDDQTDAGRRVRSRGEPSSDEIGRGQQDDGYVPMMGDDTIEQGREAPTPLDDRHLSSMMPWNQSAGSRRPTALFSGANQPASASFGGPTGMLPRHGSRLTSASPLMGRGAVGGDLDDIQLPGPDDFSMSGVEEFELFGPAAQVDTQTAGQSQWQRAVLDSESHHFLEFVRTGIEELDLARTQAAPAGEEDEILQGTIEFEALLPPETHTCIVAAQGLLHILALGTKNLLSVQQDEAYGPITMQVTTSI